MLAFVDSHHVRFVLTEIEGFTWMNLVANGFVEVHVVDLSKIGRAHV
jgi:hypothetical protein